MSFPGSSTPSRDRQSSESTSLVPNLRSSSMSSTASSTRPSDDAQAVRLTVLNTSMQQMTSAHRGNRTFIIASTFFTLPQIIAASITLGLKWSGERQCQKVEQWLLGQILVLGIMWILEIVLYLLQDYLEDSIALQAMQSTETPPDIATAYTGCVSLQSRNWILPKLRSFKVGFEIVTLFWFLVGNMWIISDDQKCGQIDGPLYNMALALIIISYVRIFWPCILVAAFLPAMCFCLPCLIRLLQRMHGPLQRGVPKAKLDDIPTKVYSASAHADDEEATCCICLNDYQDQEVMRVLSCGHHFHQQCVDEWLVVNASCPTCRASVLPSEADLNVLPSHFKTTGEAQVKAIGVDDYEDCDSHPGGLGDFLQVENHSFPTIRTLSVSSFETI